MKVYKKEIQFLLSGINPNSYFIQTIKRGSHYKLIIYKELSHISRVTWGQMAAYWCVKSNPIRVNEYPEYDITNLQEGTRQND